MTPSLAFLGILFGLPFDFSLQVRKLLLACTKFKSICLWLFLSPNNKLSYFLFQSECQTLWEALVRNPMILKDPAALDFNWCTVLKIKKTNPNAAIKFYDVYQISRKQYEFKNFVCFNNFTFQIWKINYTNAPKMGGGGYVFWKQFIIFFYLLKWIWTYLERPHLLI